MLTKLLREEQPGEHRFALAEDRLVVALGAAEPDAFEVAGSGRLIGDPGQERLDPPNRRMEVPTGFGDTDGRDNACCLMQSAAENTVRERVAARFEVLARHVVRAARGHMSGDVLGHEDAAPDAADKHIAAELEVASEPANDERFEFIEVPAEQAGGRLTTQHVDVRGETVDVCDPAYPAVRPVGEEEEVGFDFRVDPQLHASRGAAELGDADVPVGAEPPAASRVAEPPLHGDTD